MTAASTVTTAPRRSDADRWMRRLLRIPDHGPRATSRSAQRAFSASVVVSGIRCLLTYVVIPVLGPVIGLAGDVGPVVGLLVGAVSTVAIVVSVRRFFRADHRWRWRYTAVGGAIVAFLAVQAALDVGRLVA